MKITIIYQLKLFHQELYFLIITIHKQEPIGKERKIHNSMTMLKKKNPQENKADMGFL